MELVGQSPAPTRAADYLTVMADRRSQLELELARIFPQPTRFTWEVGSGHGHFLTAYAAAHPDRLCVGVDIVSERVERALRKRHRAGLRNLEFLHSEARLFLDTLPPHAQVGRTFVLFPDPWPKVRHRKHRIMQSAFLAELARRSTSDARVHFRTDFGPYFDAVTASLAHDTNWAVVDEPWPYEFTTVFQSRAQTHQSLTVRRRHQDRTA